MEQNPDWIRIQILLPPWPQLLMSHPPCVSYTIPGMLFSPDLSSSCCFLLLQIIDPHTKEYVERLRDEPIFMALAENSQRYVNRIGDMKLASRLALRRVEHIYYKPQVSFCSGGFFAKWWC